LQRDGSAARRRVAVRARRLAAGLAERHPQHYILLAQASRRGRIFLDYLRRGPAQPRSALVRRARSGFPIAGPVTWKQIESGIAPDAFNMQSPFRARRKAAS